MKHFLEHTTIGLCAICDGEPRPVKELTSNERQVTCEECWELFAASRPPDQQRGPLADEPGGDNLADRAHFGEL